MALMHSSVSEKGWEAPAFQLRGTDGLWYSLDSFKEARGLLVVFMCNHCPYVIAVHERLSALAREFAPRGIRVVGINSNDPAYKEADSFENMILTAREWNLPFPYVFDETQAVARAYDAVCTPDPYLFENRNGRFHLFYRGRIDDSWKEASAVKDQSLRGAMEALLKGAPEQGDWVPSMGCSIKWKKEG